MAIGVLGELRYIFSGWIVPATEAQALKVDVDRPHFRNTTHSVDRLRVDLSNTDGGIGQRWCREVICKERFLIGKREEIKGEGSCIAKVTALDGL